MLTPVLILIAVVYLILFLSLRGRSGREKQTTREPGTSLPDDDAAAKGPEPSILNKDVTLIVGVLLGVPVLVAFGLFAAVVAVYSGEGVGTFVGLFLVLCVAAYMKLRFM